MQYLIKRGVTTIATVTPTGQQSKKIMGENLVTMGVDLSGIADLQINDYADIFGERYFLLTLADIKKSSSRAFNYTITLKGWQYMLDNAAYRFPDANNQYTLAGQTLMGNLDTFIDLLIVNANRDQSGWVKGTIDASDFQNLTFNDNDTCLSVLATLAQAYNVEWWVDGQTIHMTKKGTVEAFNLKYGQGNGLYSITRTTSTNRSMVTRLYVYGSEKNIPADYKGFSNKLKLPGTVPYLEKNIYVNDDPLQGLKYGVIEPKRPGEPDCTWADIGKIQRDLGWKPAVPFDQGVHRMMEDIELWRDAPLWDPQSIAVATKTWFEYLGREA